MKRAVLAERKPPWSKPNYASRENPSQSTDDLNKAFVFRSIKAARDVKRGLRLRRAFVARALPKWLS